MGSVLITGASGFIGHHLWRRLLTRGERVVLLVRASTDTAKLAGATVAVFDGDTVALAETLRTHQVDTVFHIASRFQATHAPADVGALVDSNVRFGAQLLEAMAQAGVQNFVTTGTSWQHFHSLEYRAVCLYAATKQAFEDILKFYTDAAGIHAVNLKLFDTYGPGDDRKKLFWLLRNAARSGETLAMSGGEQLIDAVHIKDVLEAIQMASELLRSGTLKGYQEFAVSSQRALPLKELVALYQKATGLRLAVDWGARPYREREVMVPWSAGQPIPGWTPRVDLETGLAGLEQQ